LHLIQEFGANRDAAVPVPIGINPEGNKLTRMEAQSARFEAGQVYLPEHASWLATLLHELLGFPKGRYDDQVDSISQFLNWAESFDRREQRYWEVNSASYENRSLVLELPGLVCIG